MKDPAKLWRDLKFRFAEQSKCKSRQVGCVVIRGNHVIAEGWNGAPEGSTCDQCPRPKCRGEVQSSGAGLELAICAHAEANAIGNCARRGVSTHGAAIHCTTLPCAECAKLIVAAGIHYVSFSVDYPAELTRHIFANAGVTLYHDVGEVDVSNHS